MSEKADKLKRWANIWRSQFKALKMENLRPSKSDNNAVVLIKMDAIGDFLIWLDSASQYPKIYKGKKLTLICNAVCEEIAKHTGLFDEIIPINSRRFEADNKYKKEILQKAKNLSFDILQQTEFSRTLDMDILAYNIPAGRKIAFKADDSRMNLSRYITFKRIRKKLDAAYDMLIPSTPGRLMELERNAEFIRGLGCEFQAGFPELPKSEDIDKDIIPPSPYAVIFPGGSSKKKMWPIERYAQTGEHIVREKNMDIYLCGGKNEEYLFDSFMERITDSAVKARIHNYFGKTSLLELAEVIRNARLLISNDTSGIHFAAATDTKGICMYGEFDYGRFLPYKCERECPGHNPVIICSAGMKCAGCSGNGGITPECRKNLSKTGRYLCIDNISVEQVIEQI